MTTTLLVVAVAVAAVFAVREATHRGGGGTVAIRVSGRTLRVSRGSTLGALRLQPRAGDLVAVDGSLLRRAAIPGKVLLDGRPAAAGATLHEGDRVILVAGRNRREPVQRRVVRVPRGMPDDPQFFLARRPGSRVVVRGAISRKVLSTAFQPDRGRATVEHAVALTFDDGPSRDYTSRIVATLKRLHVHATFFVIGYLADEYPSLVRLELRAGMTVGNHSYNHPEVPPFDRLPARLISDEIELGADSLRRVGAAPTLFRPPGGGTAANVVSAARSLGERIVLWSVDPDDWQPGTTAAEIAHNVLSAIRPGSIVDLHDGGGDRSATLAALPAIVKGIRHRGLRLVAVRPT